MSFSSEAKAELCRAKIDKKCCAVAESYGVLLYCNSFSPEEIRIITASEAFAARLPKLFRRAFSLGFDVLPPEDAKGKRSFLIRDRDKLSRIFETFGAEKDAILEIVFNTSMAGYQEILSDPSYTDQAVVMTYPLIGNYGMAAEDYESDVPSIGAMIVRDYNDQPSHYRSVASALSGFPAWTQGSSIVPSGITAAVRRCLPLPIPPWKKVLPALRRFRRRQTQWPALAAKPRIKGAMQRQSIMSSPWTAA